MHSFTATILNKLNIFAAQGTRPISGGFRNLESGVQPVARKAHPKISGLPRPLAHTVSCLK